MRQARLSTIFSSSKKKADDFVTTTNKKMEVAKGVLAQSEYDLKVIGLDSTSKKDPNTLHMKLDTHLKLSARKSKCKGSSKSKVVSLGNATQVCPSSASKVQLFVNGETANATQISNENKDINSVKTSDLNLEKSHTQLTSRNLKRVKVDDARTGSEDRMIYFEDCKAAPVSKHTLVQDGKELFGVSKNPEPSVASTNYRHAGTGHQSCVSTGDAFNLADVKIKKRSSKRNNKESDQALDKISTTSLQVIRSIIALKRNKPLETVEENRHEERLEKCAKDQPVPTAEPKKSEEQKTEEKTVKVVRFQTPKKVEPKSGIANLSKKTLDVLKKLRKPENKANPNEWICEQNKTENDLKLEAILNGPSLSEKYSELIADGETTLVLPAHFKNLVNLLRA
jgi:hypothetical protein